MNLHVGSRVPLISSSSGVKIKTLDGKRKSPVEAGLPPLSRAIKFSSRQCSVTAKWKSQRKGSISEENVLNRPRIYINGWFCPLIQGREKSFGRLKSKKPPFLNSTYQKYLRIRNTGYRWETSICLFWLNGFVLPQS